MGSPGEASTFRKLEAIGQVGDDVIVVARLAMVRVEDRRRFADQHGVGNEPL
jgi:hypothetical protein